MARPRRKAPPRNPLAARIDALEASVAEIKDQLAALGASAAEIDALSDDVEALRAALAVRRKRNPVSPQTETQRLKNAAAARASKEVGDGSGKVRTKAMQTKLQREAKAIEKDP